MIANFLRDVSNEESMAAAKKDMEQEFENLGTITTISRLRSICVKKQLDKNHVRTFANNYIVYIMITL